MYAHVDFYGLNKHTENSIFSSDIEHNATVSSLEEAIRVADGRLMLFISEATKADYDDPNNQIAVS
jgi:hypothetical protein